MGTVTAAVSRPDRKKFSIEELVLEEPRADEVLVRFTAAGLCHTDLEVAAGNLPTPLPVVAGHEGAGPEKSFGANIRLPWEQGANPVIAEDKKLVTFKYFFTRKLMFIRQSDAIALFPGGFGTLDEGYEVMTLVQTGKAEPMPIVFLDAPGGDYWAMWRDAILSRLFRNGLISAEDFSLFKITNDVDEAVEEIRKFYRVFNSSRFVGEKLVIRLNRAPSTDVLARLHEDFADLPVKGGYQVSGALPEEEVNETSGLPRLVFHFNRVNYGRLRQMIDFLNDAVV